LNEEGEHFVEGSGERGGGGAGGFPAGGARLGRIEVEVEGTAGAIEFAFDGADAAAEGADAGIEDEEVGGAFSIFGAALEAIGEDLIFEVEEARDPEDVVGDVDFEGAAGRVWGVGGEEAGLAAEIEIPGFGQLVAAREGVVEAGVAGDAGLAGGGAGAGGLAGVGAIGGEFSGGHGGHLSRRDLRILAASVKRRMETLSISAY
jgi:hypothetical protein